MDPYGPLTVYTEKWQYLENPRERKRVQNRLAQRKFRQRQKYARFKVANGLDLNGVNLNSERAGTAHGNKNSKTELQEMQRGAQNLQHVVLSNNADAAMNMTSCVPAESRFDASAATATLSFRNLQTQANGCTTNFEPFDFERSPNRINTIPDPIQSCASFSRETPSSPGDDQSFKHLEGNHSLSPKRNPGVAERSYGPKSHELTEKCRDPNSSPSFAQLLSSGQEIDQPSLGFAQIEVSSQEPGFDTLDPLATTYYTATLDENTEQGYAQFFK